MAQRGKSSVGWFYGFKWHLVINEYGEIMSFIITPGNVDDRKPLLHLFEKLTGKGFGDRGYIGKKWAEKLKEIGVQFMTSVKKNMKKCVITKQDKYALSKRGIVETVIDQLKNICQIQHSRHRSFDNFIINTLSALTAYFFKPRKPTVNLNTLDNHAKIIKI